MNVTLPADVFWLLRVPVKPGETMPFALWMWWHYQFQTIRGTA